MMKRAICIVLVMAVAGSAFAAAVKIRDFEISAQEPAGAAAMAILNYANGGGGKTIVQITISGFTPNTTYNIVLDSPTNGAWIIGDATLQTDENGDGHVHFTLPVLDMTDSTVKIGFGTSVYDFEVRAVGSPS